MDGSKGKDRGEHQEKKADMDPMDGSKGKDRGEHQEKKADMDPMDGSKGKDLGEPQEKNPIGGSSDKYQDEPQGDSVQAVRWEYKRPTGRILCSVHAPIPRDDDDT